MVHAGFHVLCSVFQNLTSDVVLGMNWLHAINPQINWHSLLLSMDCKGHIVYILGTQ